MKINRELKTNRELIDEAIVNMQEFMKRQAPESKSHDYAKLAIGHLWQIDREITELKRVAAGISN